MKKTVSILFFLVCFSLLASAQINWGSYSQSAANGVMERPSVIGLILNIPKDNNSFWTDDANIRYFNKLAKDTAFLRMHSENIVARITFDTSMVHFFLHGVDKYNAESYQFRVVEYRGRAIEPWGPIIRFTDSTVIKSSGLSQIAYLGGYSAKLSDMLVVDVRKKNDGKIISTAIVAWKSIRPIVTNIYTSDSFDSFLQRLQYPWANQGLTKKGLPLQDIKLPSENGNLIFFLKADIYHRKQVQYQLLRNGYESIPWRDNDFDNSFIWLKKSQPGKYLLNIRYAVQPGHVTTYRFEIMPLWYQSTWFKVAAGGLVTALLGTFLFMMLLLRQKVHTRREVSNKTKLQLELKAIHAQLNPHFVFNALSSIQGLINKHDIRGANSYLSDFAKLMRESLKSGNRDDIPLKKEINILETYLKLEKLRFGFEFTFIVAEQINAHEVNIPSLLLQPLVENAIKHGIASAQKNGNVDLNFNRMGDTLIVTICDNGTGFDTAIPTTGYGLKLTRERIKLLNELKPEQGIELELESQATGTLITLTFNNWFL